MELVLLLIVAVCVFAWINNSKKRKDLEEKSVSAATEVLSTSPSITTSADTPKEEEEPSGPPQNTIYEFAHKLESRLCPFCDGENQVGAEVCCICGREI